jgi:hypothetical protein
LIIPTKAAVVVAYGNSAPTLQADDSDHDQDGM